MHVTDKLFVVAGASSLFQLIDRAIDEGQLTVDVINKILDDCCDSFMFSFGDRLARKGRNSKKNWDRYLATQMKSVNFYNDKEYLNGDNRWLYVDSGGYQIQMNCLRNEEIPKYMDCYEKFLIQCGDKVQYAFSLEIAPSPVFSSDYDEIVKLNQTSYNSHANLPDDIRKKILSVYHFRTPLCLEIWRDLLINSKLYEKFSVWSIGGMAANNQTANIGQPPLYSLAVSDIVRFEMDRNNTEAYIHILGSSSEYDLLLVTMMKKYFKKLHNFDVVITMDSSKAAQQVAMGRFNDVMMENGDVVRIELRSKDMNVRLPCGYTSMEMYNNHIVEEMNSYGANFSKVDDFYFTDDKGVNRLKHEVQLANMLYVLYYLQQMTIRIDKQTEVLMDLDHNSEEYISALCDMMQFKSKQFITRKGRLKACCFRNVVDIIKRCDPDYNKTLIDKYMWSSEIVTRTSNTHLLW